MAECNVEKADKNKIHHSDKETILQAVKQALGQIPSLRLIHQENTDLEIESNTHHQEEKREYSAYLLLQKESKTAVFWEMIWDGSSIGFVAGLQAQKIKTPSRVKESYLAEWDQEYAEVREIIKEIVTGYDWNFQTAVFKRKAMYPELGK